MAKVRDLGINVIPMTMRPLEIGPGAAMGHDGRVMPYWMNNGKTCHACACDHGSNSVESSCDPSGAYDDVIKPPKSKKAPKKPPAKKPAKKPAKRRTSSKYHESGFTNAAVEQLKQQLRTRLQETNH